MALDKTRILVKSTSVTKCHTGCRIAGISFGFRFSVRESIELTIKDCAICDVLIGG